MRKTLLTTRNLIIAFAAACALAASCKADKEPAKGQLMLSVQTDMKLPDDVDTVRVEISVYGNLLHGNDYAVGPSGLQIPATLGIVAGENPATPVTIRVIAKQSKKERMLKEVVTTVPPDRIALLRVPIQWFCDEELNCPQGQTCEAGRCVDNKVDSSTLETWRPELVYGGAPGPQSGGKCLDTVVCFSQGYEVPFDATDCSIDKPAGGQGINVAVVKAPKTDGICGPEACLIPLDANERWGWREVNGRIRLPMAACERITQGKAEAIAVTTACPTKTDDIPTCGPWSSVNTPGGFDAGAPDASVQPESGAGGSSGAGGAGGQGGGAGTGGAAGASGGAGAGGANDAGGPFGCVGSVVWPAQSGQIAPFQLQLNEFATQQKPSGITVAVCLKSDTACANPSETLITDGSGIVNVTKPMATAEGIDSYFQISGTGYPSTLSYLYFNDPSIVTKTSIFTLNVLSQSTLNAMMSGAGLTLDPTRGHVIFTARDCDDNPAAGLQVTSLAMDGSSIAGYASGGLFSTSATQTDATGGGALINLIPGTTSVEVSIVGAGLIGQVPVVIRAGYLTSTNVVPTP